MVEWLTPRTLNLEVSVSSLACYVVSVDKKLYSTLSLHLGVKMDTGDILLRPGNPAMD